jgi:hypothetical protein
MSDLATYLCQGSYLESSKDTICRALKLAQEHLGKKDRATISIMPNGAFVHRMLGDWKAARALASRSFFLCGRLKGFDHEDTLSVMAKVCRTFQYGDDAPMMSNRAKPYGAIFPAFRRI